jgi:hypothetical protein
MRKRIVVQNRMRSRWGRFSVGAALMLGGVLGFSGLAGATEPASVEVKAGEIEPCPYLTEARYPFLECKKDAWGNVVFDAPVQEITGLRMPEMDAFVDGAGYWGS